MGAICRGCGNTGEGIDGLPCVCKLTPQWAEIVGDLRGQIKGLVTANRRLRSLLAHVAKQHNEPCHYDHNDFCQAHYCSSPCLYERIAKEIA